MEKSQSETRESQREREERGRVREIEIERERMMTTFFLSTNEKKVKSRENSSLSPDQKTF